jgi:UDP-N-acetylmuramoyl-L-alanyl-D-glutamate--2,6-diaminopimelate ligase
LKSLKDIIYKVNITEITGTTDLKIKSVDFDSRSVLPDSLFVAFKGTKVDGHDFINEAIKKGAIAIVCEYIPSEIQHDITYIKVKNSKHALGVVASNYYENPSEDIKLIGVTGTNGKTTIVTLLFQMFRSLGYGTGLLSTINNRINDNVLDTTHTTPDPIRINKLLRQIVDTGCEFVFMEVSSHAIDQERIAGLDFDGAIFTNITHEHLDYHSSFKEYIEIKKGFFDSVSPKAFSLSNIDDNNGRFMLQNTRASKYTYGIKSMADFHCKVIENQFDGLLLNIKGKEVWCKLTGIFNAYNLLAVYATSIILGQDPSSVITIMSQLESAEGRFDTIRSVNNIIAIVDYAHTPDALKNALQAITALRTKNEQLITVVGAGGDRDKQKRPLMARIACEQSDKVILTSDNPRSEEPEQIIKEMEMGIDPVHVRKILSIVDRRQAIKTACAMAKSNDIILVAGKGHEKYQEIKGKKYPFDDKKILIELLEIQINN